MIVVDNRIAVVVILIAEFKDWSFESLSFFKWKALADRAGRGVADDHFQREDGNSLNQLFIV